MTTPFTPVPNNRAPGTPNPAGDMDNTSNELAAMGGTYNVLNATYSGGADPTDTSACDAAVAAAVAALPASGGIVDFPPGTYKFTSGVTVAQAGVYFRAIIPGTVVFDYHGSGDCVRMYSGTQYSAGGVLGGGILGGIVIDGTNSGGTGACGLHLGDIYQARAECGVRKFRADSTAKGFWFDNQNYWTEEMHATIWAEQNANNVVFDNSANSTGSATGSFKGLRMDLTLDCKSSGNGVVLQNGAYVYNHDVKVIGNIDWSSAAAAPFYVFSFLGPSSLSFTATHASPAVFTATGAHPYAGQACVLSGGSLPGGFTAGTYYVVSPSGTSFSLASTSGGSAVNSSSTGSGTVQFLPYSQFSSGEILAGVECNNTAFTTQPGTVNFAVAATQTAGIFNCKGLLDFSQNNPFATNTTEYQGNFQFDGPVYGDGRLFRTTGLGRTNFEGGTISNNATLFTRFTSLFKAATASAATVTGLALSVGTGGGENQSQDFTLVNLGPGALQFAASGSNVKGGANTIVPPLTAATFVWEMDSDAWVQVQSPPLPRASYASASGATGQTCDRNLAQAYLSGLTSETVYVSALELPAGVPVNNITLVVGGVAFGTVTHGWYALLDSGLTVRAVSADQSGTWQSTFASVTLSVSGAGYVTTYPGLYYVAFCATFVSSGEFPALVNPVGGLITVAPQVAGTSSTSQTTPPSTGTTLASLSGTVPTNARFWAWTS